MGWSYRKSFGVSPFRINLSKKGISYSLGVKGARVNISSRGTYVSLSSHGITYRQKISGPAVPVRQTAPPIPSGGLTDNITSAHVDQLTDADSQAFITELNQKSRQASYVKRWGILPLCTILLILLLTPYGRQEEVMKPALILCFCCFAPLIYWLGKLDRKRFTMELYYDMDDRYQQVYRQFKDHFATFSQSSKIWQYLNTKNITDYKRNAGAGRLIKRARLRGVSASKMPMPYFMTNVAIPCISLNNMDLFFLPERLLIKRGKTFAAVFYKNLRITSNVTRFIESELLPGDAKVVDYTWQYVNKSGGPDRRFSSNQRLPICAYSEYMFTSDTGVFEVISTSKPLAMNDFADFLSKIGQMQRYR
ncbi:DUF4236 domain-containing protein [Chitinophaga polysaccharea]|uniref:DUF4236 domain-containing protein n=1 Tax=Chitinophaga polysaccharea TaxID=1293035 RepID=UPI001158456F|nr:DUF4236 domain-containing protein [Chitinophaga polysaccharea]